MKLLTKQGSHSLSKSIPVWLPKPSVRTIVRGQSQVWCWFAFAQSNVISVAIRSFSVLFGFFYWLWKDVQILSLKYDLRWLWNMFALDVCITFSGVWVRVTFQRYYPRTHPWRECEPAIRFIEVNAGNKLSCCSQTRQRFFVFIAGSDGFSFIYSKIFSSLSFRNSCNSYTYGMSTCTCTRWLSFVHLALCLCYLRVHQPATLSHVSQTPLSKQRRMCCYSAHYVISQWAIMCIRYFI